MSKTANAANKVLIEGDAERHVPSQNKVTLTGTVVRMFAPPNNKNVAVMTIGTRIGEESNYLKVTWFGKTEELMKEFAEANYPHVSIQGIWQTDKKEVDGITKYYKGIIGSKLSYAPRLLESELGIETGAKYAPDGNAALFVGEVVGTYRFPMRPTVSEDGGTSERFGAVLTLRTRNNGRLSFPQITFYRRDLAKIVMDLKEDDIAAVYGAVQNRKTERGGETKYDELIIGADVGLYRE